MNLRNSPASVTLLPGILERIPVMLFAGDQDYICNYMGIEKLIENLEWQGGRGFEVRGAVPIDRCEVKPDLTSSFY